MARGIKVYYITSGTPDLDPIGDNFDDSQPLDLIVSKETGITWQKLPTGTWPNGDWTEISTGRTSEATNDLILTTDEIIPLSTAVRGAHLQDLNAISKTLQTTSANRYGDRYFNIHDKTAATSKWFTAGGFISLYKYETNDLRLGLQTISDYFTIGNNASTNFFRINSQLFSLNVEMTTSKRIATTFNETDISPFIVTSTVMSPNLNADLLDGWHGQEIIDEIPVFEELNIPFKIRAYHTTTPNAARTFVGTGDISMGEVLRMVFNHGVTSYIAATHDPALSDNVYCTCTCTCPCTCPCQCTCTCTGPCNCCNGSGPI